MVLISYLIDNKHFPYQAKMPIFAKKLISG